MSKLECAGQIIRMARRSSFGPNYVAEAYLSGPIDERTGLLVNLLDVDILLREAVRTTNSNEKPEVLVQSLYRCVRKSLPSTFPGIKIELDKMRLHVREDLYLEYAE